MATAPRMAETNSGLPDHARPVRCCGVLSMTRTSSCPALQSTDGRKLKTTRSARPPSARPPAPHARAAAASSPASRQRADGGRELARHFGVQPQYGFGLTFAEVHHVPAQIGGALSGV